MQNRCKGRKIDMKKRVIKAQSPQIAPKRARRFDFGPLVLLAGLLLLGAALFLLTIYRPVYDEAETREHLFMGRKADRIIGMTGFNGEYRSEFLTIPDSVQSVALNIRPSMSTCGALLSIPSVMYCCPIPSSNWSLTIHRPQQNVLSIPTTRMSPHKLRRSVFR